MTALMVIFCQVSIGGQRGHDIKKLLLISCLGVMPRSCFRRKLTNASDLTTAILIPSKIKKYKEKENYLFPVQKISSFLFSCTPELCSDWDFLLLSFYSGGH